MAFSFRAAAARRHWLALGLGAASLAFGFDLAAQEINCGTHSPAFPVPELHGATRLWPSNGFRPVRPGQALPLDRDSTQYLSTTPAGAQSGHELFWAIDIVGNYAFVMYNVGLSVWDIGGANAENPRRLTYKDGLAGQWFHHDVPGKCDGYLNDIAAIQDPANPNRILIAVAAAHPIGTTLWRFDRTTNQLIQAYQDVLVGSEDVDLIVFGGRVYAIFADDTGAFALDASTAASLPEGCLDDACPPGIHLGKIGAPGVATQSRCLGVIERGGKIYAATAYGGISLHSPPSQIWELDPAHPAAAALRFTGANFDTHTPVLFTKNGTYYMAVVQDRHVRIFEMDACLDATGCATLPAPVWDYTLRPQIWPFDYLTYSVSEGTPFLYYGFEALLAYGSDYEGLFDLTNLGGSNQIPEITATGGSYTDPCNGTGPISYWSSYYERNDSGFRNFNPRKGKFNGRYFYKVNHGTFDVHVRTLVNPTITTTATSPPPHFFGDAVGFAATAVNCEGPESWSWHATDPTAGGLGATGSSAALTWPLCSGFPCPSRSVEVWALKAACAGNAGLTQNRATITLNEPRPQIAAISVAPSSPVPNTYPVCTRLSFGADLSGKPPFSHRWSVKNALGQEIAGGATAGFLWNTDGVTLGPEIFFDGFESGDTTAWNPPGLAPATPATVARRILEEVTGAGSATFDVELTVDNATGAPARSSRAITLTALGELAFLGTPIEATVLGGGQVRFRANTANATRWRWEFEDPGNGVTTGCRYFAKCRIVDYGADDNEVTTSWTTPNLDGTYRVRVDAANCLPAAPAISAELPVAVLGIPAGSPPTITAFSISAATHCILSLNVMECERLAIRFSVSHQGTATHYDFDWEGDGTFEESLAIGSTITHTYSGVGLKFPKVRARNLTNPPSAPFGLPWPLLIVD